MCLSGNGFLEAQHISLIVELPTPGPVCILCADPTEDSSPFSSISWEVAPLALHQQSDRASVRFGVLPKAVVYFPLADRRVPQTPSSALMFL